MPTHQKNRNLIKKSRSTLLSNIGKLAAAIAFAVLLLNSQIGALGFPVEFLFRKHRAGLFHAEHKRRRKVQHIQITQVKFVFAGGGKFDGFGCLAGL